MIGKKNAHRKQKEGGARKENYQFRRRKVEPTEIHFLDLNPQTAATRRAGRRAGARRGFKAAMALIAFMGLFSLGKLVLKEAFLDNPRFHLQHVAVLTDGALTPAEIVSATGLQDGMNMLLISLGSVRDKIEELPQVKKVRVTRSYPSLIMVEAEQRQPVAWLDCPQQALPAGVGSSGCMLDENGYVLPNPDKDRAHHQLPVIAVDKLQPLVLGHKIDSSQALAALQLLSAHQNSAVNHLMELVKVDATGKYALQAVYDTKMTVTFSSYDIDKQLRRLERVVEAASQRQRSLATVNLLVEQNVPVTFRDGGTSTAAARTLEKQMLNTRRALADTN